MRSYCIKKLSRGDERSASTCVHVCSHVRVGDGMMFLGMDTL